MKNRVVITIGREFGSGGREIGRALANKLGIKLYDEEMLVEAAKSSGISEELFKAHDEKPTHSFLYSLVMDTYAMNYSANSYSEMPINHKLFLAQFDAIKGIAERESCVLVGRCSDYALESLDDITNVYIYADLDARIKRIARIYDLTDLKAKELIVKTDKKRASYYNYYTNKKWGESQSYDLCINSARLGIEETANMILDYVNRESQAEDITL